MLLAASRSSFIGLLTGIAIAHLISRNKIKLFILILVPILLSIYPLAEYYKRQVIFLYGFESIQRLAKSTFDFKLEEKFPALIDIKQDYHLRNSSFSFEKFTKNSNIFEGNLDSNKLSEYNKENISDRPLALHAVIFKDIGFLSGGLILFIYVLIFFFTLKNITLVKFNSNIFVFLNIVVVPAIFIKAMLNQGENEYYIWISVGLLANLATSNES
jgi:branched-subunit amino acid transport protein